MRAGVVSSIVNFGAFVDLPVVSTAGLRHPSCPGSTSAARQVVGSARKSPSSSRRVDMDHDASPCPSRPQEDPWGLRPHPRHRPGCAGKVTKLVPFGVRPRRGRHQGPSSHISELAQRRRAAGRVVKVGEVFVKVIDIDLERRRISCPSKQANEGVDPNPEEFDPSLYGMAAEYDENSSYKYPEGFSQGRSGWKASSAQRRLGK